LIKSLQERISKSDVSTNDSDEETQPAAPGESREAENDDYTSVIRDGVEVVNVKVVPAVDKFGIPQKPNRPTWDKI